MVLNCMSSEWHLDNHELPLVLLLHCMNKQSNIFRVASVSDAAAVLTIYWGPCLISVCFLEFSVGWMARSHRLCEVTSHCIKLIPMCPHPSSTTSACSRIHHGGIPWATRLIHNCSWIWSFTRSAKEAKHEAVPTWSHISTYSCLSCLHANLAMSATIPD